MLSVRLTAGFQVIFVMLHGAGAADADTQDIKHRLMSGYPGIVSDVTREAVILASGKSLPLDDGAGKKPFAQWLENPDIEDMFTQPYPAGDKGPVAPKGETDPGRARNEGFFDAIYGNCGNGEVSGHLVDVPWLPSRSKEVMKVTRINGVADRVRAISAELDKLPRSFDKHLLPAAGAYYCRKIAGTSRRSAHGYGIAVDLATGPSRYWRWDLKKPASGRDAVAPLPQEIVSVFEKHGFIWGGKWSHYDTMHFEYRPELLPPTQALP